MKVHYSYWLLLLLTSVVAVNSAATAAASPQLGVCYSQRDGTVYPIQGTCTSYIYCLHENAVVVPCPSGMGFSQSARGCVLGSNTTCEQVATSSATFTEYTASTESTPSFGCGTCACNEESPANQEACAGQPFGQLVPYPGNCSLFLVCNCEYPTVKSCPAGLWFNIAIQTCDYPPNVNCGNSTGSIATTIATSPVTTSSIDPSTVTSDPTTTSSGPCIPPAGIDDDLCQTDEDGMLYRYPYNCNAYVNCTNGCPVLNYCPPDKVFNALLLICDTPDTAHCVEQPLPTTTTPETTTISTTTEASSTTTLPWCNSTPKDIPEDFCEGQKNGSYHSYPENCTEYITCEADCAVLKSCPPDKVFNALLNICDTPDTAFCPNVNTTTSTTTTTTTTITTLKPPPYVNSTICEDMPNDVLFPYTANCAMYIQCWEGEAVLHICPAGWLFNPSLLICDEENDVDCEGSIATTVTTPITLPPATQTSPPSIATSTAIPTSTTLTPTTPTTPPSIETSSSVPYDPCIGQTKGSTFPYSENCQYYYYCNGDDSYTLLPCPKNNWYNPSTGACGPEVSPTACVDYFTSTTEAIIATSTNPELICENQEVGQTYPYSENCAQYKYCLGNGSYIILNCPPKNYYNPETGSCGPNVSPDSCKTGYQPSTTPPTSIESTTSTTTLTTTEPVANICGNYSSGEMVPYPGSCHKFIICLEPAPIAFSCADGLYFNVEKQECQLEPPENCTPTGGETTLAPPTTGGGGGTTTAPDICVGASDTGTTYPYLQNCELYIRCTGNGSYVYEKCGCNEYFDPVTGSCGADVPPDACRRTEATTTTTTTTPITTTNEPESGTELCADEPDGSKVVYPGDCTKYIVCEASIPVGYYCPGGLAFNAELQLCVPLEESDCNDGKTTVTTTEPTTTTLSPPYFQTCVGQPDGTKIPYPYNCSKYIVCDSPISVAYDCPEDLEFNAKLQECVQPELAGCSAPLVASTINPNLNSCDIKPDGTTFAFGSDCSKFVLCLQNAEVLLSCMPGSYFNPQVGQCSPQASETVCLKVITTSSDIPVATPNTPHQDNICCGKPSGTLLPYPEDCSRYVLCDYPLPIVITCDDGTTFDSASRTCVSDDAGTCGTTSTTSPYSSTATDTQSSAWPSTTETTIATEADTSSSSDYYTSQSTLYETTNENWSSSSTFTTESSTEFSTDSLLTTTASSMDSESTDPTIESSSTVFSTDTSSSDPEESTNAQTSATDITTINTAVTSENWSSTSEFTTESSDITNTKGDTSTSSTEFVTDSLLTTTASSVDSETTDPAIESSSTDFTAMDTSTSDPEESTTAQTSSTDISTINSLSTSKTITTIKATTESIILTTPIEKETSSTTAILTDTTDALTTSDPAPTSTTDGTTVREETASTTASTLISVPPSTTLATTTVATEVTTPTTTTTTTMATKPTSASTSTSTTTTIKTTPTPSTTKPTTPSTTTISYADSNANACMNQKSGSQVVYYGNCTKYNFCFGGESVALDCANNWYFNPQIKQCVPPSAYKCPW